MTVHRFYCPQLDQPVVELTGDEAAHGRRVLRLGVGDAVGLFDGTGTVAEGRITDVSGALRIEVAQRRTIDRPPCRIDLAVAIPKGARADTLVEKAVELGADRLLPLVTDRSVVEPGAGKLQRFNRIALEATKQCGRAWLMAVETPVRFDELNQSAGYDVKLIAVAPPRPDESAGDRQAETADIAGARSQRVLVLIGPEGGWTDQEIAAAQQAGCRPWRLGPHVMRTETAAVAALAILRHKRYD